MIRSLKLYNPKKAKVKLKVFDTLAAVESNWKYKSYGVERKIKNKITIYKKTSPKINIKRSLSFTNQKVKEDRESVV